MYQKTAAEHFAEAMNRLSKHPHPFAHADDQPHTEQPQAPTGIAFAVAFSREAGAGGITVAREVGRRLSWPVYDQELLENLAKELNVDISLLEDYDERRGSFLVDTIKAFSAAASVSEVTYFRRLVRLLQVLGARGECLIVGRGSTFVLPPETTLRVRIVATREDRIAFMVREHKLSHRRGRPLRAHQGPGSAPVPQGPFPQGPGRSTVLRSDYQSFAVQRGRDRGPGHRSAAAGCRRGRRPRRQKSEALKFASGEFRGHHTQLRRDWSLLDLGQAAYDLVRIVATRASQ